VATWDGWSQRYDGCKLLATARVPADENQNTVFDESTEIVCSWIYHFRDSDARALSWTIYSYAEDKAPARLSAEGTNLPSPVDLRRPSSLTSRRRYRHRG
jgi:hypothetical protein